MSIYNFIGGVTLAHSFFTVMKNVSKMVSEGRCDGEAVYMFDELVSLVEACPFSGSVNTKFICRNWRKSVVEIADSWNAVNSTDKTVATFNRQLTTISQSLYSIFPFFGEYLFEEVNTKDSGVLTDRHKLKLILLAFKPELSAGVGVVLAEINALRKGTYKYSLEECEKEIALIKPYLKSSAISYLQQGDTGKISYLLGLLSKPVFSAKYKVNLEKLRLLEKLGQVKVSFSNVESASELSGKKYRFGITHEMEDIISALSENLTKADIAEYTGLTPEKQSELNNRVAQYLSMLTPEGLHAVLSKLNGVALTEALSGNYNLVGNGLDTTSLTKSEKSFIIKP